MKVNYKSVLGVLAGIALCMGVAGSALAQKSVLPVYVVNEIDVIDDALFKTYSSSQQTLIEKHGGKYIIRGGKVSAIDGTPPKRFTIYVFDNADKLQAWQNDPAQKAIWATRGKAGKFRTFTAEGLAK